MSPRRLLTLTFLSASLLALPLYAQPPGGFGPGHGPFAGKGRGGERLAKYLELTAEQQTKWDELQQQFRDSVRPLFEQQRSQAEQLRSLLDAQTPDPFEVGTLVIAQRNGRRELETAHTHLEEQLKAILTPEQLTKYEAFQAARPEPFGGPHGGRRPGGRP